MRMALEILANRDRRAVRVSDTARAPVPQWARDRAQLICRLLNIDWQQFCGKGRHARVVEARAFTAYILRVYPGPGGMYLSFPEIAASMGRGGGHSTVIDMCRRMAKDPHARDLAHEVAAKCGLTRKEAVLA